MSDEFPDEDPQAYDNDSAEEPDSFEEADTGTDQAEGDEWQTGEVEAPADAPDERVEDVAEPDPADQPEPVDFEADQQVEPDTAKEAAQTAGDTSEEADEFAESSQPIETAEESFDDVGMGDDTSEAVVVPDAPLGEELDSILNPPEPEPVDVEPLPEVGPSPEPAYIELWHDGEKRETFTLAFDELVIGLGTDDGPEDDEEAAAAGPPAAPPDQTPDQPPQESMAEGEADDDAEMAEESDGNDESGDQHRAQPDVDVAEYGVEDNFWRRHLALHRRNRHHYLYALADAPIQLNDTPLSVGDSRELSDGDIIVAGEKTALVFHTPSQ